MARLESAMGKTVVDRITGFVGTVTGLVTYISGCDQALVQPRVGAEGKFEEAHWFDVQRLDVKAQPPALTLENGATPGADVAAPVR